MGDVRFLLDGGNYLAGLHATVGQMTIGDTRTGVSVDAGAGEYNEGGVVTVEASKAPQGLKAGMAVMLSVGNGRQVQATCTEMTEESLVLDASRPHGSIATTTPPSDATRGLCSALQPPARGVPPAARCLCSAVQPPARGVPPAARC